MYPAWSSGTNSLNPRLFNSLFKMALFSLYLLALPSTPPSSQNSFRACLKASKVWVGGVNLNCLVLSKFSHWSTKSKLKLRQFPTEICKKDSIQFHEIFKVFTYLCRKITWIFCLWHNWTQEHLQYIY